MTDRMPPRHHLKTTEAFVKDFMTYLAVNKGYSPLTVANYAHYLCRFSSWLEEHHPGTNPEAISSDLVTDYHLFLARYRDDRGRDLKKSTQAYHLIALRAFLRYLCVNRCMDVLSPDRIDLPKQGGRSVKFLNTDEIERLMAAVHLPGTDEEVLRALRDRAMLEVLFSTGIRVSELVALDRDQVDKVRKEFTVIGKGSKPRVVFLSDIAAGWLSRYLSARTDVARAVFIRLDPARTTGDKKRRMRLTSRSVDRIVRNYARKAGLRTLVTPHTLRHSFATDLLREGADIRAVQEMLGHSSIATTQVYTHVTDRHLRDVHRSLHARDRKTADGSSAE